MMFTFARRFGVVCLFACSSVFAQEVRISEIMYHPSTERTDEEFIELCNDGIAVVNLQGWRFSRGVSFTFTNAVQIAPGENLVVAADVAAFNAKYPGVTNVIGGWTGTLSNQGEQIELENELGTNIDQVDYADQGDWSVRRRGPSLGGTRGWEWFSAHDGLGASLERRNPQLSNNSGQNWGASTVTNGTPGLRNSIHSLDIPPLVLEVAHLPALPRSTNSVTVRARVIDEIPGRAFVSLHWHTSVNPPSSFFGVNMHDDGLHDDGVAGDGIYAAIIPPHPNRTVIEYYVRASDGDFARTWPAAALDDIGTPVQAANATFQVDDTLFGGDQPLFRVIMTETERLVLQGINRQSDAQMNATLITEENSGVQVRHNVGIRIRGAGSRGAPVPNFRVNVPRDRPLNGVSQMNLNAQFGHAQVVGSALALKGGLAVADARPIQVRVNGVNLASTSADNGYGSYALLEPIGAEFAANHFPNDGNGNVYRGSTGNHTADLSYRGTNVGAYIGAGYSKSSNSSENDWSDLIQLTDVLENSSDQDYVTAVSNVANVRAWMRYFAIITLTGYGETSLGTGRGDDFALYRGIEDPRFIILGHDFDTILAQGQGPAPVTRDIFFATQLPIVSRFMFRPEFVGIYYDELETLANSVFAAEHIGPLIDRLLGTYVPPGTLNQMKQYAADRRNFVLNQFPRSLTINSGLPLVSGFPRATTANISLNGQAHAGRTRSVQVNGVQANWTPQSGSWAIGNVGLTPGLNRVIVQAFDGEGIPLQNASLEVWYDDGSIAPVSGALATDTTWTAAGGPYMVSGTLTVPAGRTLTVEAGTTVYFAQGARVDVEGRLLAEGTELRRIRFTRQPGTGNSWAGFRFTDTNLENRITYAEIDFASAGDPITLDNSTLFIDATRFSNTTRTLIELNNSSLHVRGSVFPDLVGQEHIHGGPMPAGGHVIIERNVFGTTTGLNDIIDFTNARRPGPILQILDNVFTGASDDILDLDGTDAHIEGNLFMNVHNGNFSAPDTASAISFGQDGGYSPHIVAVRNLFYDVDHLVLAKEGGFITLVNNTALGIGVAAVNFSEPERDTLPGAGAFLDGNVFWNPSQYVGTNFQNRFPTNGTVDLVVHRSILAGMDGLTNGLDNLRIDPRLGITDTNAITLQNISEALRLLPGSPAQGTGPNGLDRGAFVSAGPSLSGLPESPTAQDTFSFAVGGPGIVSYSYQLNGGAISGEVDVDQPLVLNNLADGSYNLTVLGRNTAGVLLSNNMAEASWVVDSSLMRVVINEVLARNNQAFVHQDTFPDVVELYNAGANTVDLSGMSLTDDLSVPKRFVFPEGTLLPSRSYLVLFGDNESTPGLHLGFGFDATGDAVFLIDSPERGAGLIDSIQFGWQLRDVSIGRVAGGDWALTEPTVGAPNRAHPVGRQGTLKINEWLTDAQTAFAGDFLELYNPESVPVHLGGLFLSDEPLGWPDRHRIPDLSFIPAFGHLAFIADGNANAGADHLNFRLASEQGRLAVFSPSLQQIDCITYFSQGTDVSEGRRPSGSDTFSLFGPPTQTAPTPGGPNPGRAGIITVTNIVVPILSLRTNWRYERNGLDLGTAWREPGFDDSSWPEGPALLGVENSALPEPGLNTPFPNYNNDQITYYFRSRFVLETNLTGFIFQANAIIDDGAVIYVNGNEVLRIRMPQGPIFFDTQAPGPTVNNATLQVEAIPGDSFVQGMNVVAVEVHQAQVPSSDIVMGLGFQGSRLMTNATEATVLINEVLANNNSVVLPGGTNLTDWVELYNPGGEQVDLSNRSLSDEPSDPRRWVFPAGVSIAPEGYLIIRFDPNSPPSTTAGGILNTGFGLSSGGDTVSFYSAPAAGGSLLDSISFGLQTADFSIGRLPTGGSVWDLNLPTPGSFNLVAGLGDASRLRINEWLANPSGNDEDFLELHNPNPQPVELGGLFLTDDLNDRSKHKIAPLSFLGTGEDAFALFIADGNTGAGTDHVGFGLSANGESIGIYNRDGSQIDALSFGRQDNGVSQGRFPDGAAEILSFPGTATPGQSNIRPLETVIINEILSHTDPPFEDAIELYNPTAGSVDLSGWFLSDSRADPKRFRIPDGVVLPAGGYLVFYESQFNADFSGLPPFFALSSLGDDVVLSTADLDGRLTGFRARTRFGPSKTGVSLGRYSTSVGFDVVALEDTTFGMDNPTTVEQFRQGQGGPNALPIVGPVVINEIMYHPPDVGGLDNLVDEFIELLNISSQPVNLFNSSFPSNTWELRDAVEFRFPEQISLPAGGFALVVGFDPATNATLTANFRAQHSVPELVPIFGPYRGVLSNSGESVELYEPDDPVPLGQNNAGEVPMILVDRVDYRDSLPWHLAADGILSAPGGSLQRRSSSAYGNDPVNWHVGSPTAGVATGAPVVSVPVITEQPLSQTAAVGAMVTFQVTESGGASYQWRHNGVDLADATGAMLVISSVQLTNAGVYTVRVNNPFGAALSAPANLAVEGVPQITRQPASRTVVEGAPTALTVTALGTPPLSHQWLKDQLILTAETNASLIFPMVTRPDEGEYQVVVANSFGAVTSVVAFLSINTPPSIVDQPQSTNVFVGSNVVFSVTGAGSPPLRYQWRRNNLVLQGQTNQTLTLNNVQLGDAGEYTVQVANNVGVATSLPATLVVLVPPTLSIVASDPIAAEPGEDTGRFTILRQGSTNAALSVEIAVSGSALAGSDYQALASPVFIPAGATNVDLLVSVEDDALPEGDETVVVTLQPGSGYLLGSPVSAVVTIKDEDNLPPTITLTNPPPDSVIPLGQSILLGASASDPDGAIVLVEFFYNETNKVGQAVTEPFMFTWADPPSGNLTLTAVATDNLGSTAISGPVSIQVNGPPTVVIIAPANGTQLPAPATIQLTASASDPEGQVSGVEFFEGATSLGIVTNAISPLRADYQFGDNLASSGANAPDLVDLGANGFQNDMVDGQSRRVFRFQENTGLSLGSAASLIPSNIYTIVLLFRFDETTSWRRVLDFKNGTIDDGLYVLDSALQFYPTTSSVNASITPDTYLQVVLTRDAARNVAGYVDGIQQFSFSDSLNQGTLDAADALRFFRDDGSEASAGAIARLRVFSTALSPAEVGTLDRLPSGPTSGGNYSLTVSNVVAGDYVFTARATDELGASATSDPVTVHVIAPNVNLADAFANRSFLSGFVNSLTGNNSSYTSEPGEPRHDNRNGAHSGWIAWTAPESGLVTIDTFGSSFDSVLAVYVGDAVSALVRIASNDDAGALLQSQVSFFAEVNTTYQIAVDGYASRDSGTVVLNLDLQRALPSIVDHPRNATVSRGSPISFSVTAAGAPPLSYQWRLDGTDMPGAVGPVLAIVNVQPAQAGSYTVVVGNSTGSVESNPAILVVRAPPTILTQPEGVVVDPGDPVMFSVLADGTPPLRYQWRQGGVNLSGATNDVLLLGQVRYADAGLYQVIVSNASGSSGSQPAELIIRPRLGQPQPMSDGSILLLLEGSPGGSYVIQGSTNTFDWVDLGSSTAEGGMMQFIDPAAVGHLWQIYRARLVTP